MEDSAGFRRRRGWLFVVLALTAGQGWLTLRLFSTDLSPLPLFSAEPIVSGEHPLHLYHGELGVRAWQAHGTSSCYDPAFQAGYPKTPVFDPGSRPAELFLLFADGNPAAYKLGLALCCLLVPLAFVLMGRGVGLCPGASCVAGLLGGVLWWSPPVRTLLDGGDLDLLLGGLCVLVTVCWLVRFSDDPGIDAWLVITGAAALGWYVQPLLFASLFPLALLFYGWIAFRHGLAWHMSLAAAAVVAFLMNYSWLSDWARYLWVRLPFGNDSPTLPPKPLKVLVERWQSLLPDDLVSLGIGGAGVIGLLTLVRRSATAAVMLLLSAVGLFVMGAAGRAWEPLHELGSDKLLPLVIWCAVPPSAALLAAIAAHLGRGTGYAALGGVWLVVGLVGLACAINLPQGWMHQPGLRLGLGSEREQLVRILAEKTDAEGRILFEERAQEAPDSGWTALLADRTRRQFVGGLAPHWGVEHLFCRLAEGKLAGKPIDFWTDAELGRFCERYNIGWAVCWTDVSKDRFRKLPWAKAIGEVHDGGTGVLFALERSPSFILRGKAQVVQMDWERVALADVIPDADGYVVLSLHHLSGWRIAPNYVHMERDYDALDPVPLIRLKMPGTVARLTLTWENP